MMTLVVSGFSRTRQPWRTLFSLILAGLLTAGTALAQPPQQPVPQPFPRPGGQQPRPQPPPRTDPQPAEEQAPPPAAQTPARTTPAGETEPTEETLGVPIYPGAQFLTSYDAGKGQRYYLFGANMAFEAIVTYYGNVLRERGDKVFDTPATHIFELGRFREETMAFPPSVTVKDYTWGSEGYLNPNPGNGPDRFRTVVQIVPPPPGAER